MKIEADIPELTPTEIVEQIREADRFLGSVNPKPGQKIWIFDLKARTIKEAEFEYSQADFKTGAITKKLVLPPGCFPIIAINKKNAMRKLMKSV